MSGIGLNQAVGGAITSAGPTLEVYESKVAGLMKDVTMAHSRYMSARSELGLSHLEVAAHRASVLSDIAFKLYQEAADLQRAAYEEATK